MKNNQTRPKASYKTIYDKVIYSKAFHYLTKNYSMLTMSLLKTWRGLVN